MPDIDKTPRAGTEVEIAPEIIEAGAAIVRSYLVGAERCDGGEGLAQGVFHAMILRVDGFLNSG